MSDAIRTEALYKTYPGPPPFAALHPLTLSIGPGELVVVLGPNGAGKTTFFKMLATLVQPSGGQAWVAGHPLHDGVAVRRQLGIVSDPDRSFFWRLDARANLDFFAQGYGLRGRPLAARIDEVLEALHLREHAAKPVGQLSSGQRGRLALARALIHRPPILLLDEPTRALDPSAASQFLDLLRAYLREQPGASALLSTHRLGDIASYEQRLLILSQGRLQADGRVPALLAERQLASSGSATDDMGRLYHLLAGEAHA